MVNWDPRWFTRRVKKSISSKSSIYHLQYKNGEIYIAQVKVSSANEQTTRNEHCKAPSVHNGRASFMGIGILVIENHQPQPWIMLFICFFLSFIYSFTYVTYNTYKLFATTSPPSPTQTKKMLLILNTLFLPFLLPPPPPPSPFPPLTKEK